MTEIETYWTQAYPEIDTASNKIRILEENGYSLVGYLTLSPQSWQANYYAPLAARFTNFLDKHDAKLAKNIVAEQQREIDLYQKYQDYYSYGFYVARKV